MNEREQVHPALRAAQWRALLAVVVATAVVALKVALVRVAVVGGGSLAGLALDVLFVFSVMTFVDLFFSDMRLRALIAADAIFSALLLGLLVYHGYYSLLPTRESFAAIGQAATVTNSIVTLFKPLQLLLFIDIPLIVWWGSVARRGRRDAITGAASGRPVAPGVRTPYVYLRRWAYVAGIAALLAFAVAVAAVRSGSRELDGFAVTRQRGLTVYLAADILGVTAQAAEKLDPATLQPQIDTLRGGSTAQSIPGFEFGQAKGANVIVIQVEALQAATIGAKMGGLEVTPNLNRLIERSWYFPNHMSAIGRGTTSDAEYVVNTSLYPPYSGAAALMYVDHQLPSISRMLGSRGYRSWTFHTNTSQYWNRAQLYPALGFDQYFDNLFFGSEDKIAFGSSDRVLFEKTFAKLSEEAPSGPFYAQLVTMSSHYPFTEIAVPERKLKLAAPYIGTIEGDYLTEINYTDRMIGAFIERLEASGILDRSILVIYGDHFGLPEPRSDAERLALRELLGREYTPVDRLNTPLIIRLPGQKRAQRVETPVGQIDIMPSVAEALGVDTVEFPHFGRSVFSRSPVLFEAGGLLPLGSYVDSETLYVAGDTFSSGTSWDIRSRSAVPLASASEDKYDAVKQLLDLSDRYVKQLPTRADFDPYAKIVLPTE